MCAEPWKVFLFIFLEGVEFPLLSLLFLLFFLVLFRSLFEVCSVLRHSHCQVRRRKKKRRTESRRLNENVLPIPGTLENNNVEAVFVFARRRARCACVCACVYRQARSLKKSRSQITKKQSTQESRGLVSVF